MQLWKGATEFVYVLLTTSCKKFEKCDCAHGVYKRVAAFGRACSGCCTINTRDRDGVIYRSEGFLEASGRSRYFSFLWRWRLQRHSIHSLHWAQACFSYPSCSALDHYSTRVGYNATTRGGWRLSMRRDSCGGQRCYTSQSRPARYVCAEWRRGRIAWRFMQIKQTDQLYGPLLTHDVGNVLFAFRRLISCCKMPHTVLNASGTVVLREFQ